MDQRKYDQCCLKVQCQIVNVNEVFVGGGGGCEGNMPICYSMYTGPLVERNM